MTPERFAEVDRYLADLLAPEDAALEAALAASEAAGLPAIQVSANQGKLLHLLAQLQNARSILEIGTLGGYSTIWLARALPADGRLVTLEADAGHARVARENLAAAGLAEWVDVRVGDTAHTLRHLRDEGAGPFDLIFVDADKASSVRYLEHSLELSRPGTLLVFDNVVRGGAVTDGATADPSVRGIRDLLARLATDPRVSATAIQTVGDKGWDGLAIARVTRLD